MPLHDIKGRVQRRTAGASGRLAWAIGLVLALTMATPAMAGATEYFVSPTGTGTSCDVNNRCSLDQGLASATASGDEVALDVGSYSSTGQINLHPGVSMSGSLNGPSVITFTGGPGAYGILPANGSAIRNLELVRTVDNNGAILFLGNSSGAVTIDHVQIRSAASAAPVLSAGDPGPTTISQSLIEVSGASSVPAVQLGQMAPQEINTLSGDTIINAHGPPLRVTAPALTYDIITRLNNSIVRTTPGDPVANGPEIENDSTGIPTMTFETKNSNYATPSLSDNGGTGHLPILTETAPQRALPSFVNDVNNAATSDYHETGASPTIGAGSVPDDLSDADLDGQNRTRNGTVDIGAYEYTAPVIATLAPTGVSTTAATLHATVDSDGYGSTDVFSVGKTTAYGEFTSPPLSTSGVGVSEPVNYALSGLTPGTTYHYRLCSTGARSATTCSPDQTFTTTATGGGGGGGVSNAFTLASKSAGSRGSVLLSLRAPGAGQFRVSAQATITVLVFTGKPGHRKAHKRHKTISYASGKILAGGAGVVKLVLRPNRPAFNALVKSKHLKLSLSMTFTPTGGVARTQSTSITVKAPATKHKHKHKHGKK